MDTLQLEQNFNNKLACNAWLHIDWPPKTDFSLETLIAKQLRFDIKNLRGFEFNMGQVVVQLINAYKCPLKEIPECMTLASHGMSKHDFLNWWQAKYPAGNYDSIICCYYYKNVSL